MTICLANTTQPSLATSTTTSHYQVRRNRVEVCQRRRSNISTRTLCPSGGCPWSTTSTVCVNSLHFTASSSDLYWTAKLRLHTADLRCGTISHQPCANLIGFACFLLLSIPSLSTRIVPLRFQVGGRRRRPNLVLVCCVCVICIP